MHRALVCITSCTGQPGRALHHALASQDVHYIMHWPARTCITSCTGQPGRALHHQPVRADFHSTTCIYGRSWTEEDLCIHSTVGIYLILQTRSFGNNYLDNIPYKSCMPVQPALITEIKSKSNLRALTDFSMRRMQANGWNIYDLEH